jgi:hypothetical protein
MQMANAFSYSIRAVKTFEILKIFFSNLSD